MCGILSRTGEGRRITRDVYAGFPECRSSRLTTYMNTNGNDESITEHHSEDQKRLFLASYFAKVSDQLEPFFGDTLFGKTVCFIPTASLVEKVNFYVGSSRKALLSLGASLLELDVSTASSEEITTSLNQADLIFVEGGNTFYLLQELRRSGADQATIDHVNRGKP